MLELKKYLPYAVGALLLLALFFSMGCAEQKHGYCVYIEFKDPAMSKQGLIKNIKSMFIQDVHEVVNLEAAFRTREQLGLTNMERMTVNACTQLRDGTFKEFPLDELQ